MGIEVEVIGRGSFSYKRGSSLREALLAFGIIPYSKRWSSVVNCYGLGFCGLCKVWVVEEEGLLREVRSCQYRLFRKTRVKLREEKG